MSELPPTAVVATDLAGPPRRGRGTAAFVLRTLGGGLVSVGLIVVLGFFVFRVLPGDPVTTMTRDRPGNPEQLARLRAEFGLDRPLPAQFVDYLADVARGDLGTSYVYSRPVTEIILGRLGPTVLLTGSALVVSVALGLWLGSRAAWRHGSVFDRLATGTALVLWSVPTFWLGLIALMVFAVGLDLFPTGGMTSPGGVEGVLPAVLDVAHHLVLPCLTMVAVVYAQYLMVMRSSLLEEMSADYLTTARAKGLREDLVRRRHAVPNALLPTITIIFLHVGLVVAGAVTVETVFSWPGLGLLTYQALAVPDIPLLQGTLIALSVAVVLMNVLADLGYRLIDPRVRAS
jgi:peptide/nickel transport system permease protein